MNEQIKDTKKSEASLLSGEELLRWRKRNSYYYKWLERIYRFVVRPSSRVLHIGCEAGDLLAAVKPSYGVGIDENIKAVEYFTTQFMRQYTTIEPGEDKQKEREEALQNFLATGLDKDAGIDYANLSGSQRYDSSDVVSIKQKDAHISDVSIKVQVTATKEVEKKSKLDPSAFFEMIDKVTGKYPHVKVVATTLREVHSTNHHSWSAVAWIDGQTYVAPTAELNVYDRVGGGDGFASGFFYGLLTGEEPQDAVNLGWAHGALLTTFPGDTTMATVEQVRAFAQGGSARIQR